MRRPTWTGTATPVSRPGSQARKIFVFDSIVVVRNPGGTLSPADLNFVRDIKINDVTLRGSDTVQPLLTVGASSILALWSTCRSDSG